MAALRRDRRIECRQGRGIRPHRERVTEEVPYWTPGFAEDGARLEQGEIDDAAREVAVRDLQKTGHEGSTQERCQPVERVGELHAGQRLPDGDP